MKFHRSSTISDKIFYMSINRLPLYKTMPCFNDQGTKPFENNVGKGENAGFPFSHVLYPSPPKVNIIVSYLFCLQQMF